MPVLTVLFDAECPFCRFLAELGARRAEGKLAFHAWQEFRGTKEASDLLGEAVGNAPADKLRVLRDGRLLAGEDAWGAILEVHPDLKALEWLAARLGLTRAAAAALDRGGSTVRRICWSCRYFR